MLVYARDKVGKIIKIDFIRFGIVGAIGFVITVTLLKIFHGTLGINLVIATLLSSEGGLLSNFFFHEKWTYKYVDHQGRSVWKKFVHFHMSSWSGVLLITLIETISVKVFHIQYLVALFIASAITMFWNFFWTKYFIFKGHAPKVLFDPEDLVAVKEAKK
ncbi:MAG: GtrA family protein [Candidatus Saccharibacteria bacterium]